MIHPTRVSDDKVAKCVWEGRWKMVDGEAVDYRGECLGESLDEIER